jgi:hypothetical protein
LPKSNKSRLSAFAGNVPVMKYLAEFDFRYNNRVALGVKRKPRCQALSGITGKRLYYRQPA